MLGQTSRKSHKSTTNDSLSVEKGLTYLLIEPAMKSYIHFVTLLPNHDYNDKGGQVKAVNGAEVSLSLK